jgi:hypothetical protein
MSRTARLLTVKRTCNFTRHLCVSITKEDIAAMAQNAKTPTEKVICDEIASFISSSSMGAIREALANSLTRRRTASNLMLCLGHVVVLVMAMPVAMRWRVSAKATHTCASTERSGKTAYVIITKQALVLISKTARLLMATRTCNFTRHLCVSITKEDIAGMAQNAKTPTEKVICDEIASFISSSSMGAIREALANSLTRRRTASNLMLCLGHVVVLVMAMPVAVAIVKVQSQRGWLLQHPFKR